MNKWGIMQGRFTDKSGFYPQQFPSGNWEREFDVASQQKIQYIEWMFNFDNYENNPLWSRSGREEIKRISAQAGISVVSVCANYFMRQGFFKSTASGRARSLDIYRHLLEAVNDVGAQILVLPLFDDNNPAEKDMEQFYESLMQMADMAEEKHVRLALEADFSADKYMEILSVISSSALGVCYDLGNAAGLGRNIEQELEILHDVI